MTPRTGRPTDDPKNKRMEVLLSESDVAKLDYCHKVTGKTKGEIIRIGIDKVFQQLAAERQK